jgi:alkylhydroperoxidase/carboxymuconolactone decarboxylase family protein YurZ
VSLGLSALQGYLAAPGAGDALSSGQIIGNVGDKVITAGNLSELGTNLSSNISPEAIRGLSLTEGSNVYNALQGSPITSPTFLQSTENLARNIGSYGAETFEKGREGFENIIGGTAGTKDLVNLGKAYVPGALQASGELAYNAALDAQKKYEQEMLAMGNLASSNKQDQINYIRRAMVSAGFNEDEISSAISRSGFMYGGKVESGLMSLKMGGMPAEMDLRKGGFVPLGKKERADDVPARLSKNEFVFTAKAVRNAGNGDVRKGAKRMYKIMNQLEARA